MALIYGVKRDYRPIDLFVKLGGGWRYVRTTTWARTCKEAKARFLESQPALADADVRARFAPS